jgi:hypothetical protein
MRDHLARVVRLEAIPRPVRVPPIDLSRVATEQLRALASLRVPEVDGPAGLTRSGPGAVDFSRATPEQLRLLEFLQLEPRHGSR